MSVTYLFRHGEHHRFITTQDPEYAYEHLCGHCGYPVEPTDDACPRCQRELEDCPVCVRRTHRRATKVATDPKLGGKLCPVCHVRRIPFGERSVTKLPGKLCGNIYGCPAGGLLLASDELAVLPENASRCPVCRHEALTPLEVCTFLYLLSNCVFCNTLFGSLPGWMAQSPETLSPTIDRLRPATAGAKVPCPLCGRRDELSPDTETVISRGVRLEAEEEQRPIKIGQYLRMVELGRILVLYDDDQAAFTKTFDTWFSPLGMDRDLPSVPVTEIVRPLLEGTLLLPVNSALKQRLAPYQEAWEKRLPGGLGFHVAYGGNGRHE